MNIAILLTGISLKLDGHKSRDWRLTCDNIKNNIIECWGGVNTNIYLTTYNNNDNTELLEYYKPKKYNILEFEGSDQRLTYLNGLELLLDEDVDFIISTRFDIHFKQKICDLDIKFDKFNFLFRERGYRFKNFVSDNIFLFPKKYLKDLINSVYSEYKTPSGTNHLGNSMDLHNTYNRLLHLGEDNLNVISHINEVSMNNSFYKIIRY
jgi:hypothetical protein